MRIFIFFIVNFVLAGNFSEIKSNTIVAVNVQANNDLVRINEDSGIDIPVLKNDFGLYDGVQILNILTKPENGSVQVNNDFTVTYTPEVSFYGEDLFTYEVCNIHGSCGVATVNIIIDNIDHKPVAVKDEVTYLHGVGLSIPILYNDTIKGDYPFDLNVLNTLKNGKAYLNEDHYLVVEFNRNFGGIDSLQYTLCDSNGDCSQAWVVIDVQSDGTSDFYIPNGFSPNGDGLNDTFFIPDFRTYLNIQVNIFTEWGQLVYQNKNYRNNWGGVGNTGAMKGKQLKSGTYYYVFNVDGIEKAVTGYIYLSR